jgi:hypothetical protein
MCSLSITCSSGVFIHIRQTYRFTYNNKTTGCVHSSLHSPDAFTLNKMFARRAHFPYHIRQMCSVGRTCSPDVGCVAAHQMSAVAWLLLGPLGLPLVYSTSPTPLFPLHPAFFTLFHLPSFTIFSIKTNKIFFILHLFFVVSVRVWPLFTVLLPLFQ